MLDTVQQQTNRKDDHITHALAQYQTQSSIEFEQTRFIHQSFPECDIDDIDTTTYLDNLVLTNPFFINAMTGGSTQATYINQQLAILARETDLAMATGSVSIALRDATQEHSFKIVRQTNPNGIIFANLGAHHNVENAKKTIDLLEANALQIHVNTPQEMIMPEGERHFTGWLKNIEHIVKAIPIPIIVKEVGFGMSKQTAQQLINIGVKIVDISGKGGTNFAQIEDNRRQEFKYNILHSWGQTTLESLVDIASLDTPPTIIASGGIKNALDIAKCLALGATSVGLSGQFLHLIQQEPLDTAIHYVQQTQEQLKTIMTLLGTKNIKDLQTKSSLILAPSIQQWCQAREINWIKYANRL